MKFLFPAFLFGALAVAVPIALHFLRRDVAPEVPFTAVRLLQRSPLERSRRRRLRDLLLLAARVAALLLLAFAFARPYIAGAAGAGGQVRIVAIDRSFSMGAPGRFAHAMELARGAIDEASRGEPVALVAFDDRADVVAEPGSPADARAALKGIAPGYGATRFAPVLARAAEIARGAPATLVLVTDLQRSGWEDEARAIIPSAIQVDLRDVGPVLRNAAVMSARAEPDRVLVQIGNSGPPSRGDISILRDGRRVAGAAYTAGPDSTFEVPVDYRAPSEGSLVVSITDTGGFSADDTRHVLLDRTGRPGVVVLTTSGAQDSAFYLARALAAAADDEPRSGFAPEIVNGARFGAMTAADLRRFDALVVLSTRGLDRRARENAVAMVRRGAGVIVAAAPDVDPAVVSSTFEWNPPLVIDDRSAIEGALAATDLRHPIFRPFGTLAANLGQVRFERAWRVRPEGWEVTARFTDGTPALLERAAGAARVVVFASDLDRRWNDFPLHPAFVPFAVEAIRYVAGGRDHTSDYTVAGAPRGTPPRPGVYRVEPENRPIVVNVDTREASVSRLTSSEFMAMIERTEVPAGGTNLRAQQAEASQGMWRYGLLLMIVALVAESVVGRA